MHKIITALKRTMEWVLCTWGEGSWAVPTSQKPTRNNAEGFAGAVCCTTCNGASGSRTRCGCGLKAHKKGRKPNICSKGREEKTQLTIISIENALENAFCFV